jgi:hypothetical protein
MHIHAENIDLYARHRLSEFECREIEIHLASCSACQSKVDTAVEFSQALVQLQRETDSMRAAHRIPTDDPATVQAVNPPSLDQWAVRIRDVSTGGMGLRTPKPINRGTQVIVRRGTLAASGEVRYCIRVGEMFHVGIRVQEIIEGRDP